MKSLRLPLLSQNFWDFTMLEHEAALKPTKQLPALHLTRQLISRDGLPFASQREF